MALKQCSNGHYYDPDSYGKCPYCTESTVDEQAEFSVERPTEPAEDSVGWSGFTQPNPPMPIQPEQSERTVSIFSNKGIDPVVGWLVCIDGKERGLEYRLHEGINQIGRSSTMDICIQDETISRENHAWVAYDEMNRKYFFGKGMGRNLVYVNNQSVIGSQVELKNADQIKLGACVYRFVPLCSEEFNWQK